MADGQMSEAEYYHSLTREVELGSVVTAEGFKSKKHYLFLINLQIWQHRHTATPFLSSPLWLTEQAQTHRCRGLYVIKIKNKEGKELWVRVHCFCWEKVTLTYKTQVQSLSLSFRSVGGHGVQEGYADVVQFHF